MRGLSASTELLTFEKYYDGYDNYYLCKLAINGTQSEFSVPASYVEEVSEEELASYLERQASSLIERYGDFRDPRPDPALLSAA